MSHIPKIERHPPELEATIEDRHLQPDLCTIFQPEEDELRQMELWITAKEGSFVDLGTME